jgi:hypothetical protein
MSTADVVSWHDYAAASSYLSIRFGARRAQEVAAVTAT